MARKLSTEERLANEREINDALKPVIDHLTSPDGALRQKWLAAVRAHLPALRERIVSRLVKAAIRKDEQKRLAAADSLAGFGGLARAALLGKFAKASAEAEQLLLLAALGRVAAHLPAEQRIQLHFEIEFLWPHVASETVGVALFRLNQFLRSTLELAAADVTAE